MGDDIENHYSRVILGGQTCIHDRVENLLYHWLREPFWSAGKIYGWPGSPAALGANRAILDYAKSQVAKIRVFVQEKIDRCYETDPETWFEFARKYKAIYWASEVAIYLLQWCPKHFRTVRGNPIFAVVAALLQGGACK